VSRHVVCVPVDAQGRIDPRWGRAHIVAVAEVDAGRIERWSTYEVGWDELHDIQTEGRHHADVARFLQEQGVTDVVVHHLGEGMDRMLRRMGLTVHLGAEGDARAWVEQIADASS
jgi:predicted Fe-Mo cluster-binding NifX family protein